MSDIVERLHLNAQHVVGTPHDLMHEAADTIDTLRARAEAAEARVKRLEEAIRERREIYAKKEADANPFGPDTLSRFDQFRHAREAFDMLMETVGMTVEMDAQP